MTGYAHAWATCYDEQSGSSFKLRRGCSAFHEISVPAYAAGSETSICNTVSKVPLEVKIVKTGQPTWCRNLVVIGALGVPTNHRSWAAGSSLVHVNAANNGSNAKAWFCQKWQWSPWSWQNVLKQLQQSWFNTCPIGCNGFLLFKIVSYAQLW